MKIQDIRFYMVSCLLIICCLYLLSAIFSTVFIRLSKKEKTLFFSQSLQAKELERVHFNLCFSVIGIVVSPLLFYLIYHRYLYDYTYLLQEGFGEQSLEVFITNIPLYLILVINFLFSLLRILTYLLKEQLSGRYLFLKTGTIRIKDVASVLLIEDQILIRVNKTFFNCFSCVSPEGKHRKTFEVIIVSPASELISQRLQQTVKPVPLY